MALDLWVIGLFPLLLAALFFYLLVRIIWAVVRGIGSLFGIAPSHARRDWSDDAEHSAGGSAVRTSARICPDPLCRRANDPVARYCGRCGRRL
jgi:hypothetical protein